MTKRSGVAGLILLGLLVGAVPAEAGPLSATIRRTAHGIPRILASDYAGLGYGYGYSFARDNICQMADSYTTVRGERSRYFGPDGSYAFRGNGTNPNNLNSDFFFRRIIDAHTVEGLLTKAPPLGPRPEVREVVRGYVAGYDQYISQTGVAHLSDPTCRGQPWVKPITEIDAYRRFYQLALLASAGVAIDGIGAAQPPTPPLNGATGRSLDSLTPAELQRLRDPLGGIGSNAVALGSQATDNASGMLLGNPHFPWTGSERFYESQLTIPGKLNVSGASLFGVPLILIGHTDHMAWSHTVSTAFRFTPFELRLVPGSSTTYLVDGQPHQMDAQVVSVDVRQPDGSVKPQSRTLYSADGRPVLTSILGLPIFPWTPERAYVMGDANAQNFRYLNHFFETDHAQSVSELDAVLRRNQGIPWVNTIAADSTGKAYYADLSVVPNVPDTKTQSCSVALGLATDRLLRLPVLDGSRSACAWESDRDAVAPGIFGPGHLPSLVRPDYVTNSNDSYWLANPHQPLTGFARIIGDEGTARSLRTRLGLTMVEQRLHGSDGRPGRGFSLVDLRDMVFNDRQYAGELFTDQLVAMCRANPTLPGSSGPVDVSAACPVLAAWDRHDNLDSRGALLFRRFASRALAANASPFQTPFDPADPVNTPRGLNTDNPQVRQALADAVTDLRSSNIPLDARLGDYQYEPRGAERIPIHGGPGTLGVFNAINDSFVAGKGYPVIPHGSSFVMVAQFLRHGACPVRASTILTYSQSVDSTSPYFADQTRMFSRKQWVDEPFCERDIRLSPGMQTTYLGAAPHPVRLYTARRTCVSRRRLLLRLHGAGTRVVGWTVAVNGRIVRRFRSGRRSFIPVDLRGRPRGRYTITVTARTVDGQRLVDTRRYRTCARRARRR